MKVVLQKLFKRDWKKKEKWKNEKEELKKKKEHDGGKLIEEDLDYL